MAAYKLVVSIYSLADEIEGQFQRQTLCFRCLVTPQKSCDNLNQTGRLNSKIAASKPEILKSQLPGEIETKLPRLNLHFRGPAIEWD